MGTKWPSYRTRSKQTIREVNIVTPRTKSQTLLEEVTKILQEFLTIYIFQTCCLMQQTSPQAALANAVFNITELIMVISCLDDGSQYCQYHRAELAVSSADLSKTQPQNRSCLLATPRDILHEAATSGDVTTH
ncbi:hypothetical protein Anapl_01978 [Anas platyrhynchos]|uniref:Uncharacterized protein n=1 Tax=Anas platyrhynchos TaxID=8839 RepID=R0KB29_ANAPL|nr:hypothetical protein Anapl_01978 [Anas platyrhynchos]